jgi:hypothetical protein
MAFGKDYMIVPSSKSFTGSFKPLIINSDLMKNPSELTDIIVGNKSHPVVILDSLGLNNPELYHFVRSLAVSGVAGISAILEVHPNVPGGRVGRSVLPVAHFQVKRESLPAEISSIGVKVSNEYEENYTTRNLIGYIPGHSEKVILFTAHYDMLGSFGEDNFFPAPMTMPVEPQWYWIWPGIFPVERNPGIPWLSYWSAEKKLAFSDPDIMPIIRFSPWKKSIWLSTSIWLAPGRMG